MKRPAPSMSRGRRSIEQLRGTFSRHSQAAMVLDDEIQDAFDPNTRAIKVWEHLLLGCLLYEAFLVPYFLTFEPEVVGTMSVIFGLAVCCECVFFLDLYVQAHTGHYSDGNAIRDKKKTQRRYLRSHRFALDVVAILPYSVLVQHDARLTAGLSLFKLLRCSRLPHLVSSLDAFYAKHFVALKLLKVLVSMVYMAHILACVRFSFGFDATHTNHWLPPKTEHEHPLRTQYLASLFWSVGLSTGLFEGELPHNSSEFIFTILVALGGFSMFTTLCATIFVISKCESGQTEAVEARINQLVHLLSFHRSSDREAARRLCPSIANDIQVELVKSTIAQISLFVGCSDQFIVALTSLLEMIAVPAQTTLFSVGDYGDAMYIIHSGVLTVVVKAVTVRELRKGTCFGELSIFSSQPRTATVLSTTYSILYKLSRFHCERVLEGYPSCASLIRTHVDRLLGQMDSNGAFSVATTTPPVVKIGGRSSSVTAGLTTTLTKVLTANGDTATSVRRSITEFYGSKKVIPVQTGPAYAQIEPVDGVAHPRSRASSVTEPNTEVVAGMMSVTSRQSLGPEQVIPPPEQTQSCRGRGLWRYLLLQTCIDHQSRGRMWWLVLLQINLCFCWLVIPVQVVFPLWQQPSCFNYVVDNLSNFGLLLDLILNFSLSFLLDSEKIRDPVRSAQRYLHRGFFFDLLCAIPYEYSNLASYGLLRLPRLARVFHLRKHLSEIEFFIPLNTKRQLLLLGVLLSMMFHVVACTHFGISYIEGFNGKEEEDAWIPSVDVCLRRLDAHRLENCAGVVFDNRADHEELLSISFMQYSRSLYYAVGVLASPGKSVEPASDVQLIAALVFMLSGFLITAIVVDNVQKRFTASAFEQKEFFATSTRIQLFLRRQNAPLAIHHRVKSFLDFWWSSHRGAAIGELLADLPRSVRLDVLRSICTPVLQTLALLHGVRPVRDKVEEMMVENVKFILYGQGEIVYRHGDYVTGLFFLLEGEVCVVTMGGPPREVPRGGFFGTAALTQQERGEGYTEHVSANSGCILLFVSRDQLQAMESVFPALKTELLALEQRLLSNKLVKTDMDNRSQGQLNRHTTSRIVHSMLFGVNPSRAGVYDPDSLFILAWETWLFLVMTLQWVWVMYLTCFRIASDQHGKADASMAFLELSFVLDIFIRSRLGYYEYGNKVMNPQRIRRTYFRSRTFALDIAALLPLYVVNWALPSHERWDLLNINKLLRLFKVPKQLHALETRYLKRTTELRLFKLLYYTFMLSHVLGCVWFDFASKVAVPNFSSDAHSLVAAAKKTAFGGNEWLPSETLEHASPILQYMASLYWSFGLMSASSEPELPKTTAQCVFSVATMTSGFFLFAYVIGNFTDIIELTNTENREFNAKMGAVRHMLEHFQLPESLQERLKTFYLFKRFHTITQEHLLVRCLPPSLLTDIRLVHLKPMIEKVEFLSGMEGSVTRMLVSQFTQVIVSRDEFVCRLGEQGSDMFFVFTGVLSVFLPLSRAGGASDDAVGDLKSGGAGKPHRKSRHKVSVASVGDARGSNTRGELKKVNEISAGSYFGENGLFTNGRRNAHIQAQTSCILYKLSRESLELVFDRYPEWKLKVLRIANIHHEQTRLAQLSRDEQRRGADAISRADIMNERAERMKEELQTVRLQGGEASRLGFSSSTSSVVLDWLRRFVLQPVPKLLHCLVEGVQAQSSFHLFWLRFTVFCVLYIAILTPYQLAMDDLDRSQPVPVLAKAVGLLCELVFILDIWFSSHVKEAASSMELYEQSLRGTYKKERMLWDVVAAVPIHRFLSDFHGSPWLRLLRCVKMVNIVSYLDELNRRSVVYEVTRFWYVILLYLLVLYWVACAYLAVAMTVGFGSEWEGWLPSEELELADPQDPSSSQLVRRFLRGLFFATTTFVKKGRNLAPHTASLFAFHIAISFVGLITMSFVIGELASLFLSYIGLEVDFRKNHIAVELYLARQHVSEGLKTRTHAFMTSLWSSHAGVNYEQLLTEMPRAIRTACVLHVSKEPVGWFVKKTLAPTCWASGEELESFTHAVAERLRFEGYPCDECVVVEGSIARAMYFVVRGHLQLQSRSLLALSRPIALRRGDFFGERGLLAGAVSAFTVRTVRACDLLSLNSEALTEILQRHAFARFALGLCGAAYGHLKAQSLVACSKWDMEMHWGAALLTMVTQVRGRHEQVGTGEGEDAAASTTPSASSLVFVATTDAARHSSFASLKGADHVDNSHGSTAASVGRRELEVGELPGHTDRMLEALTTTSDCFAAFSPLLQLLLPTDPLDWSASLRVTRVSDSGDVSGTMEPGGYLKKRRLSVDPSTARSENPPPLLREEGDQQLQTVSQDLPPTESKYDGVEAAANLRFASRIRSMDVATSRPVDEGLTHSVEMDKLAKFSSLRGLPAKQGSFDSVETAQAVSPPVRVLRKPSVEALAMDGSAAGVGRHASTPGEGAATE
ncbi:hypothetical protein BBJ28_00018132 [Nothophytophthora sp. Chile5]|nr:hypothetical protein BBJ28_00018132 [Nothophytophthora sp. Chile5]